MNLKKFPSLIDQKQVASYNIETFCLDIVDYYQSQIV